MALLASGPALVTGSGVLIASLRHFIKGRRILPSLSRRPGGIVVHHSAAGPDRQHFQNAQTIGRDHKRRGLGAWHKGKVYHIAYHYVILPDGTVEKGRPEKCRGGHTRSWKYNHWIHRIAILNNPSRLSNSYVKVLQTSYLVENNLRDQFLKKC